MPTANFARGRALFQESATPRSIAFGIAGGTSRKPVARVAVGQSDAPSGCIRKQFAPGLPRRPETAQLSRHSLNGRFACDVTCATRWLPAKTRPTTISEVSTRRSTRRARARARVAYASRMQKINISSSTSAPRAATKTFFAKYS